HVLVGGVAQPRGPPRRRHRHRQHDPGRAVGAGHLAGGPGRRAGGDAVVDDDGGPAGERHPGPVAPEAAGPALQLGPLPGLDLGDLALGDTGHAHDLGVDHPGAVLADRAHAQLGLERHAQLADDDDVQRRAQRGGDLVGHRDTTPGQAQHDDGLVAQVRQLRGQPPPGISPIAEPPGSTLAPVCGRRAYPPRRPLTPRSPARARRPSGDDGAVAEPPRGHRLLPHTADVMVEAWGPDLAACCEEAVAALAAVHLDVARAVVAGRRDAHLPPAPPDRLVLAARDEAIFLLDTADGVPVAAEVRPAADGGLDVTFQLADPATVEPTGAVPKAVSSEVE